MRDLQAWSPFSATSPCSPARTRPTDGRQSGAVRDLLTYHKYNSCLCIYLLFVCLFVCSCVCLFVCLFAPPPRRRRPRVASCGALHVVARPQSR